MVFTCVLSSLTADRRQCKGDKQVVDVPISSVYELHQPEVQHRVSVTLCACERKHDIIDFATDTMAMCILFPPICKGLTWIPGAAMKMTTFQVTRSFLPAARCAPASLLPDTAAFPVEQSEPSLWDSCNSLTSNLFPPDLVHMPEVSSPEPSSKLPR